MKITREIEGKMVRITDNDGNAYEGLACDYVYPEDNEPEGIAGICLENCSTPMPTGTVLGFNETDIKSIEILG